jgi:hypothetical protein
MRLHPPRLRSFAACFVSIALFVLASATSAFAHGVGMSQLKLEVAGTRMDGEWDFDLRDARMAAGLDPAVTGAAGWSELQRHEADLRAVLTRALTIQADSARCLFMVTAAPMAFDGKLNTVTLHVLATSPVAPRRLTMHCDLLFDRDPAHRAYFMVLDERVTSLGVFRANERTASMQVHQFEFWGILGEFIREGTHHIWTGIDHMMFLLALLLPASLLRRGREWAPRAGFASSLREVLKVVTAFTLAHSITLSLAYFGVIRLPSQWVEVGIALSVFAAAWNNLRPFLPERAWAMAFGFGLVHGMGFAGALSNLQLPRHARLLALGAFNVGVELGQLALVIVAMPLLYAASRQRWYPQVVMGLGSLAIAWVSVLWVLERAFGLMLFHR